jgi:diguanylate cyclase (GGDEF)-like protein
MAGADIIQFPHAKRAGAALPRFEPVPEGDVAELQLLNRLHQHLDVQTLLEQFLMAMCTWLPLCGIRYTIADTGETFVAGRITRRCSSAALRQDGETLGTVEVFAFSTTVPQAQTLLGPLASPLRNALAYHRAMSFARRDSLSGLGNRSALDQALATEAARAQRFGLPFTLLVVDIDHFKNVNDTLGHSAGDGVIRGVAAELAGCLRPYDQAFRYGGEEFVVLLGQTGLTKGMEIAERIRRRIAARCRPAPDPGRRITVSVGVAGFDAAEPLERLFDRADKALYRAKEQGRNRSVAATH